MVLEKIEVNGLFGIFTHTINFKTEGKITLILGENGLGKTVILKMIKAFFDQNFTELKEFYYETFTLFFEKRNRR